MSLPAPEDNSLRPLDTTVVASTEKPKEKVTLVISDNKNFYHYHMGLTVEGLIRRGYNVEQSFLEAARSREAFVTRRVQMVTTNPAYLMSLAEQGEKVLFGPATYINLFVIAARRDFEEEKLSRPPNIGISMLTSLGHYIATLYLEERGIEEANWVQIGKSRERIAALLNGSIDLSAVQYDEAFYAISGGAEIKILSQPKPIWVILGIYEEWLEQNTEFVKDFIKTLILAKIYCRSDKDRHVSESIKYAEQEESPELVRLVRDTYEFHDRENFWTSIGPQDSFYEDFFRWSIENKVIEGSVDFRSLNRRVKELANLAYEEMLRA